MNNSIKQRNSKDIKIQLNRAEVQKRLLIKNLYKEYENYFKVVRKSILTSSQKGIFSLYTAIFTSDNGKLLNTRELINFLNQNIKILINSKLHLLTIEQLNLGDTSFPNKKQVKEKDLEEFLEVKEYRAVDLDYDNKLIDKEYQAVDLDYENELNELINKEYFEFHCNNNSNSYEYYDLLSENELSSVNLDDKACLNTFSKPNIIRNIKYEKDFVDSVLAVKKETKTNKIKPNENLIGQDDDVFIPSNSLIFFENIDKEFNLFLLNLSYKINSELFNIKLIKKFMNEDTFIRIFNNNVIKYPHPFIIKYDLIPDFLSQHRNHFSDIYLFNISKVELEFYNFELSICRSSINELKNKFRLLNKKQLYWENKEFTLKNIN